MKKSSLLLILAMVIAIVVACSTQPETNTVVETVAPERAVESVEGETAEIEESSSQSDTAEVKRLTINNVFWPDNGLAIETFDALPLSRWGVIEGLVKIGFDGQLGPGLAESWEQRQETIWVFNLRSNVTFQNGEPFNADAVVNALTYLVETQTPPSGLEPENIVAIEAEDDQTVVITTTEPDSIFPSRLSGPSFGILAPSAYNDSPPNVMGTGTGPFILIENIPAQSALLVKNENYWGGTVNLDEVMVLSTPEGDMRATMLRTGELDIVSEIPIPQLPLIEAESELNVVRGTQPRTITIYLNNDNGPMADVQVRRAVLHAIDKETLVAAVLEGVGKPAAGPFDSLEAWANTNLTADTFDPDKARDLLTEAGITEGELTLRLWTYDSRPAQPPIAVAIQQMLSDVDLEVDVWVAPYNAVEADVLQGDFDMFIVSRNHLLDNYDPEGFLTADFSCGGSYNLNMYCNPTVDELLAQAKTLADPEARYEIYRQIQTIVVEEDVTSIWLTHTEQLYGYHNHVLNFQPHFLEYHTLTPELDIAR